MKIQWLHDIELFNLSIALTHKIYGMYYYGPPIICCGQIYISYRLQIDQLSRWRL